jgi:hypothetical protein
MTIRNAVLPVFIAAALAMVPSTAAAQTVGPVTCVKDQVTEAPNGAPVVTTGCSLTYKNKSAFCGKRQETGDYSDTKTYCEIKAGPYNDVWCGDHVFTYFGLSGGTDQFTGCSLETKGLGLQCGRFYAKSTTLGYGSEHTALGCKNKSGETLAMCTDRVADDLDNYPQKNHDFYCSAARFNLDCRYAGDLPGTCHVSLPPAIDCDIDLADPAGSLVACLTGAGARRAT